MLVSTNWSSDVTGDNGDTVESVSLEAKACLSVND